MRKLLLGTVVALMASPLLALPASAATCVMGTVASYEALGSTGCSVGGVTFSNISVSTVTTGSGTVGLGEITPITFVGPTGQEEFGLSLNYSANTGSTPNSSADVAWIYDVSGSFLGDAYASFAGTVAGGATATMSEILSNGITLSLGSPGTAFQTFPATGSLSVIKDQNDFSGSCTDPVCNASTSVLQNAFSLTATPLPGALPLFATGLLGLWGVRKRRGKQNSAAAA